MFFKKLFKNKPASPARHELLKIDGRMLEVRVRLNPRARRMIVKVNPATGEVSVTVPSRRGLSAALDFARGEKDWITRQLAKAPGPVALVPGAGIEAHAHLQHAAVDLQQLAAGGWSRFLFEQFFKQHERFA